MSELPTHKKRIRREGAYVVKAAESHPQRVEPNCGPRPPVVVTGADRRLAAALLARKGRA
jgi:hypothetical protein